MFALQSKYFITLSQGQGLYQKYVLLLTEKLQLGFNLLLVILCHCFDSISRHALFLKV